MIVPLLSLSLFASLVSAGLFSETSVVKMLDQKSFKSVMKENRTTIVAFVAPWCGHCQNLSPQYEKAATKLSPLVPLYAVDCDAEKNKRLCAEQGIKGFPTVKLFKKGAKSPGIDYQGARTTSAIYNWAKSAIPNAVTRVKRKTEGISEWAYENRDKPRALLLNKSNKVPLLWVVLGNQFDKQIAFGNARDRRGLISKALGFPNDETHRKPKVLLYLPGQKGPVMYEGLLKYEQLAKFFKSVAAGTVDISSLTQAFKEEKQAMPEMDLRREEADAIMQGGGYGNPHGGMTVGDDGLPIGDVHEGHGGADYAKYIAEQAAKAGQPQAQKPLTNPVSEAHFDDVKELGDDDDEGLDDGEGRDNKDEL
ncbi:thioredoxin-domain-containing protein [Sistotremastrum suecicum HHB10207 ss-3]|uniref:Thioredoxin-domain-containing protein n=1 Tax=Sistotremastrum suecicum HHB10207 ss-3 TaxID=1314776 RepID=A0A166D5X0_9AGAM|nr:thioredoxin-domain-containing protein [Sistotremastrum suecicum HHB10207 ss-3]